MTPPREIYRNETGKNAMDNSLWTQSYTSWLDRHASRLASQIELIGKILDDLREKEKLASSITSPSVGEGRKYLEEMIEKAQKLAGVKTS